MQEVEDIRRRRRRLGGEKGEREWTDAAVDDDEDEETIGDGGEGEGEERVAAEQKLKCLHLWQNQQPVDRKSRLSRR